tara:strand:- start:163 stop:1623 length:1461 start_codon:yes stop_codon:yes gene_type:complete
MRDNNIIDDIIKITNAKIFCLGDLMLDKYIIGSSQRISPEGPIPILDIKKEVNMLGGVGNVARNLGTIGIKTYLVGLLGNDEIGNIIEKKIKQRNIVTKLFKDNNRPTTLKTRFIANDQQILRTDKETLTPISLSLEKKILKESRKMILNSDSIILSDYGKGLLTQNILKEIICFANKNKKPIILDPKGNNLDNYKGVTILTPNINELELVAKKKLNNKDEIVEVSRKIIKKYNFKHMLITRGKLGMLLVSSNNKVINLDTEAKQIYDVSGAGDTVTSFLAACLGSSITIDNSIKIANSAAGIVVSKSGTSVAHLSELILSLNKNVNYSSKINDRTEANNIIKFWIKKKELIGFTNGCFDYLHPGHVLLLKQAKKNCTKLIVAVNSDSSVKKIKGPNRPKQSQDIRSKVLAAIKYVDLIIIFNEKSPIKLIKQIKPSLLVKGSDYKENKIVGAKLVKLFGGKILRVKIFKDFSSSLIIEEISNSSF